MNIGTLILQIWEKYKGSFFQFLAPARSLEVGQECLVFRRADLATLTIGNVCRSGAQHGISSKLDRFDDVEVRSDCRLRAGFPRHHFRHSEIPRRHAVAVQPGLRSRRPRSQLQHRHFTSVTTSVINSRPLKTDSRKSVKLFFKPYKFRRNNDEVSTFHALVFYAKLRSHKYKNRAAAYTTRSLQCVETHRTNNNPPQQHAPAPCKWCLAGRPSHSENTADFQSRH